MRSCFYFVHILIVFQVRHLGSGSELSNGTVKKRDDLGYDQLFFHPDESNRIVHHSNSTIT